MILEIFEDNLTKDDLSNVNYYSSRAIILRDEKILLLYSKTHDYYMLPGGRIEADETPEECIIREVLEETGYHVVIDKKTVVINEHFRTSNWHSHFFLCDILNNQKEDVCLTSEELLMGIEPLWISFNDALSLLDLHDTSFSFGYHIMQREFLALINSL